MLAAEDIIREFALFRGNGPGIESWITDKTPIGVLERLAQIADTSISLAQLNQLLILSHEAGVSDGFFAYYWKSGKTLHRVHPYDVTKIPGYSTSFEDTGTIQSIQHLKWGLHRFYTDALLYFGNVREAYRYLRQKSFDELSAFFKQKRFDTERLKSRGQTLAMQSIAKDDRYLIAELACKTYEPKAKDSLVKLLTDEYRRLKKANAHRITFRDLVGQKSSASVIPRQGELEFSIDEVLDEQIEDEAAIVSKIQPLMKRFEAARKTALINTEQYISMIDDLDIYVATSMRTRADFRKMAEFCENIFGHAKLKSYALRYFDPTLSAASGHEDKGLIECLMVKCAKILIYVAGERDSYGKDAEAAMALSQGKPVIFFCDATMRSKFYREIHPLSRLIEFSTGIPVGAIVTDKIEDVIDIVDRVLTNDMEYKLEQGKPGHFQLKESLTNSIVRLQTADLLLREAFWNYYSIGHRR
uniref:Uncharacterized protein n=1 Tax=Rhodopseudomonas palustris (strain BisA53) TaxID=316055 RepID=Q07TU6_RHOP5